jgi:hypothetical protein
LPPACSGINSIASSMRNAWRIGAERRGIGSATALALEQRSFALDPPAVAREAAYASAAAPAARSADCSGISLS